MLAFLAPFYEYIYIIIVAIFSYNILGQYKVQDGMQEYGHPDDLQRDITIVIILILFFGLRTNVGGVFVDMGAYSYQLRVHAGEHFLYNWNTDNKIFDNLIRWWSCNRIGETPFFLFMATIYFGCSYVGIRRLFPNHTLPAYLVFLAAFSTFSYATNGIKAGAAASIFIMALGFMDNKWISIPLVLISWGFHHSMALPVAAFAIVMLYDNPQWYFYGWALCFVMALLHITYFQNLFGGMTDEQGAGYLIVTKDTTAGGIRFRPDFILYSAVPVIIGYIYEMRNLQTSEIYSKLLHFYLVTNGFWMLCMYASFNNRIAYLSWFVYPIVLIYPFLYIDKSPTKYFNFSRVMEYHLYFTLFMVFVYYGLLGLGH